MWVHTQLDGPLRGPDDCALVVIPPAEIRLLGLPKDEPLVEGRPRLVGPEGVPETGPDKLFEIGPLDMGPLDIGPDDTGPDVLPGGCLVCPLDMGPLDNGPERLSVVGLDWPVDTGPDCLLLLETGRGVETGLD